MSRRARPSARTTRTAPTAPCVPVTRDGARVPRSVPRAAGPVTGNGSCTSVEGGSERSTGSPGGPRGTPRTDGRPDGRPGPGIARGGDRRRGPARPRGPGGLQRHLRRSLLRPLRLAGGRLPGGPGGHPLPGRGGRRAARERALPGRPADRHLRWRRPGAAAVPPAARRSCCCRSWRSGVCRSTTRPSSSVLAGDRRRALLVGARPPAGQRRRPPGDDDLLRLRHGLLVHRPDRDDLVPGAHRRGRADLPVASASCSGPTRGGRGRADEATRDADAAG